MIKMAKILNDFHANVKYDLEELFKVYDRVHIGRARGTLQCEDGVHNEITLGLNSNGERTQDPDLRERLLSVSKHQATLTLDDFGNVYIVNRGRYGTTIIRNKDFGHVGSQRVLLTNGDIINFGPPYQGYKVIYQEE